MNMLVEMIDHPLGHRLGWALCHSIWEGALGAAVFAVVRFGLRRRSANARYLAACTMLVVLVVAPIITMLRLPNSPVETRPGDHLPSRLLRYEPSAAPAAASPIRGVGTRTPRYLHRGTEILERSL